jgi:hypothetical protein
VLYCGAAMLDADPFRGALSGSLTDTRGGNGP